MSLIQQLGSMRETIRAGLSPFHRAACRLRGVQCHPTVTFIGTAVVRRSPGSELILGERVHLNSALLSNELGCFQPCVLRTLTPDATLRLNEGVGLSGAVVCAGKEIIIGENTIVGSGAMIVDNDFHDLGKDGVWTTDYQASARPVRIGRSVFIGARAIILKGVTIGDGAVIGAGAVLTRNVPQGATVAGNPAREVTRRQAFPRS